MSGDNESPIQSSISDGIIEVVGIVSSFHMAQLQVGLNKPIRLGQARKVCIRMRETFPVQADGEPWIQVDKQLNQIHYILHQHIILFLCTVISGTSRCEYLMQWPSKNAKVFLLENNT